MLSNVRLLGALALALVPCAALAATTPALDPATLIPTKPTGVAGDWELDASLSDGFTMDTKGTLGVGISAAKWMDGFYESDECPPASAAAGSCTPLWHGPQPSVIKGGNLKKKTDKMGAPLSLVIKDELKADGALVKAANAALAVDGCDCDGYGGFTNALLRSRGLWAGKGGLLEAQIAFPDVGAVKGSLWVQGADVEISVDITRGAVSASAHTFGAAGDDSTTTTATAEHAVAVGTGKHTYAVHWDATADDLEVFLDGALILTLPGSEWNPAGAAATDLSVMVDFAPHEPPADFAAPAAAMSLHYLAAFAPSTAGGGAALVGDCTVLKKAGVAYNGPIVAKFNNAGGATPITDVAECAQKCAENAECTYFAVNKSPSKGCVLKSNRRGSPVKNAAFLGHGSCEHAVPAACATTGAGQGWSNFKKNKLGSYKNIKNEGGCAQKCAGNAECKYWLVHNRLGCVLNTAGTGKVQNKKGYMFHGTCSAAPGTNE